MFPATRFRERACRLSARMSYLAVSKAASAPRDPCGDRSDCVRVSTLPPQPSIEIGRPASRHRGGRHCRGRRRIEPHTVIRRSSAGVSSTARVVLRIGRKPSADSSPARPRPTFNPCWDSARAAPTKLQDDRPGRGCRDRSGRSLSQRGTLYPWSGRRQDRSDVIDRRSSDRQQIDASQSMCLGRIQSSETPGAVSPREKRDHDGAGRRCRRQRAVAGQDRR